MVYTLDNNNKISALEGHSSYSGITKIEEDVTHLQAYNHCNYETGSTTAAFQGQFLSITKNQAAPLLKKLTRQEVNAYMKTQECRNELDDSNDPMSYFIAFDDNDKAMPQDDQRRLFRLYNSNTWNYKKYFGAVPNRNKNNAV